MIRFAAPFENLRLLRGARSPQGGSRLLKREVLPRFLSPSQVGRVVGRSERWVQILCVRGHVPAHRVGPRGRWQIRPEELERTFGLTPEEAREGLAALGRRGGNPGTGRAK